jgi:hypothetical protein
MAPNGEAEFRPTQCWAIARSFDMHERKESCIFLTLRRSIAVRVLRWSTRWMIVKLVRDLAQREGIEQELRCTSCETKTLARRSVLVYLVADPKSARHSIVDGRNIDSVLNGRELVEHHLHLTVEPGAKAERIVAQKARDVLLHIRRYICDVRGDNEVRYLQREGVERGKGWTVRSAARAVALFDHAWLLTMDDLLKKLPSSPLLT